MSPPRFAGMADTSVPFDDVGALSEPPYELGKR
jgi:hypothetical protein